MKLNPRFAGKVVLKLALVAAFGAVVMALWNFVMPDLFAACRPIDYAHALGLMLLNRILFGGLGGRGGPGGRAGWQKWQAMTQEERERFRQTGLSGDAKASGEQA